jgi:hypothetical protein
MQTSKSRIALIVFLLHLPACGSATFKGSSNNKAKSSDQTVEHPTIPGTGTPPPPASGNPVVNPDGTITNPDGSILNPDGTVTNPDGTTTHPDGTVTKPDGTPVNPGSGNGSGTNPGSITPSNPGTGTPTNPGTGAEVCKDKNGAAIPCPLTPQDPSENPGQS